MKPPRLGRGYASMPGLRGLLSSDGDMDACSAAAQAALAAARLAGYRSSTSGMISLHECQCPTCVQSAGKQNARCSWR